MMNASGKNKKRKLERNEHAKEQFYRRKMDAKLIFGNLFNTFDKRTKTKEIHDAANTLMTLKLLEGRM